MKTFSRFTAPAALLIVLVLGLLAGAQPGSAQTPPGATPAAPEAATPAPPQGIETSHAEHSELELSNWNYEDVIIYGPSGFATYDLGLPLHWQMQPGGSLTLFVNYLAAYGRAAATPGSAGWPESGVMVASVQVKLNTQPIFQTNLDTLGVHTLEMPLPDVWPARRGERDRLEVLFHVYGPCEAVQFSSLEIGRDSQVRLSYIPGPLALDLAGYPAPFFQRTFQPSSAVMVLPENPGESVTQAALAVAAGLGARSNHRVQLSGMTTADWDDANLPPEHAILIGTPQENPLIAKLLGEAQGPASVKPRQMEITVAGPRAAVPGSVVEYVVQVKNSRSTQAAGLTLVSWLPPQATQVACDGECKRLQGQVRWEIGSMAAGAQEAFRLRYTLLENSAGPATLINELLQDGAPVNVASLETGLAAEVQAADVNTRPESDLFFVRNGHAAAESDGVIVLMAAPWQAGKALLFVTGLNDAAVAKASRALASNTGLPGMVGQMALVAAVNPQPAQTGIELAENFTFAALGYDDLTVTGTGMKEIFYQFDLPLGWALTEEAQIRLNYTHSPILNMDQSALTLLYNGAPIASAALTPETALSGQLIARLPANKSSPGRANTLLARVSLMLPDPCADPESAQSWLRIAADSELHLAHYNQDPQGYLNMDAWPIPFAARGDLNYVLFSLPEQPTPVEFSTALKLASYLGAASGGDHFQPGVALGDDPQADYRGAHLLVIGRPGRNPLLQKVNADLPQPFVPGEDGLLQQIDDVVFRLPPDLDLGILQSIPSPWSAEHVFLAVTGATDAGIVQASDFMTDPERNWELRGNLVMLRDDKLAIADARELTTNGMLTAISTAAPEVQVIGTATPTALPAAAAPSADDGAAPTLQALSYPERYPFLLPLVIGMGAVGIILIGATIFRGRRKQA